MNTDRPTSAEIPGLESSLSTAAIQAAARDLQLHVRHTPVICVDGADFDLPGIRLAFKLEFMQHAGSFKARGAFLNMLRRPAGRASVVAASGGNHGAAVAYAAMRVVVEPGGAAAFAALQSGCWRARPESTVGVLLCGANTGAVKLQ